MLLIQATKQGRLRQVRLLCQAGADINEKDANGRTPLIHTCFIEHKKTRLRMLKFLLANGALVNVLDNFGRSVLSWACLCGREDLLQELLSHPSIVDVSASGVDAEGNTMLLLATFSRNLGVVRKIVEYLKENHTGNLHEPNKHEMTPILYAFLQEDREIARLLVTETEASISAIVSHLKDHENNQWELREKQKNGKSIGMQYNLRATGTDVLSYIMRPQFKITEQGSFYLTSTSFENIINNEKPKLLKHHLTSESLLPQLDHHSAKCHGMTSLSVNDVIKEDTMNNAVTSPAQKKGVVARKRYLSSADNVCALLSIQAEQLMTSYRPSVPFTRSENGTGCSSYLESPSLEKTTKVDRRSFGVRLPLLNGDPGKRFSIGGDSILQKHSRKGRASSLQMLKLSCETKTKLDNVAAMRRPSKPSANRNSLRRSTVADITGKL